MYNNRLIILCIEYIFVLKANLGIGVRPLEGSLDLLFCSDFESVKNIEEHAVHTVMETALTDSNYIPSQFF
jgi:hypothetical protein